MKKMNRKGFTIVELVIVIAVIAILAGVLIPTFSGIVTKANQSAALQEARNKYTEIYADDISDGVVDGKIGTTAMSDASFGDKYENYDPTGATKFTFTKGTITVTFDGTNWTAN